MSKYQLLVRGEDLQTILEFSFAKNILFNNAVLRITDYPVRVNPFDKIVVLALNSLKPWEAIVRRLKALECVVLIYHMGDELNKFDKGLYEDCDFVFRNYFFSEIFNKSCFFGRIAWVPNGYKTGVGPTNVALLKTVRERSIRAGFVGWFGHEHSSAERSELKQLRERNLSKFTLVETSSFGAGLSTSRYAALMEDFVFAYCPAGNSPETIRLYDALELGCIPVVVNHDYLSAPEALGRYGPVPFLVVDRWEIAQDRIDRLLESPQGLEEIEAWRLRCSHWWAEVKAERQRFISNVVAFV